MVIRCFALGLLFLTTGFRDSLATEYLFYQNMIFRIIHFHSSPPTQHAPPPILLTPDIFCTLPPPFDLPGFCLFHAVGYVFISWGGLAVTQGSRGDSGPALWELVRAQEIKT